ncbi:hypothetical protein [Flavobacterium sp.]|uniref:hypothetical protein n=1 Tax=Flavobacterium sp. TaxID=239 RepID=UPI003751010B
MNTRRLPIGLLIVFIDLIVYIFLGLVLLGYEDFYDESKGEYWGLKSMTIGQKAAYIGWYIWYVINILFILYILIRFFKQIRNRYFIKTK